jgi:hypothetical protein
MKRISGDEADGSRDQASPLDDGEPGLSHLVGNGVLVDLFNEPMTERIGDPESTADDPPGHRLQQPRISFIRMHPDHLP